jgi:uncharacterized protein YndB with AHSA1/START domain
MNEPAHSVPGAAETPTLRIAPVRKSVVVACAPAAAFELFTAGIDRWWPKSHSLSTSPLRESVIEPRVGGRWYTRHDDGSECVVGEVLAWDPGRRFVVTWQIDVGWKPDARREYASEVEVRFIEETPGHTRVELEHRNFERMGAEPGAKMRGAVDSAGGWGTLLGLYAQHAGGRRQ